MRPARSIGNAETDRMAGDRDARLLAARIFVAQKNLAKAAEIPEGLMADGRDYRPWFELGVSHVRQGDSKRGMECLKRSLELNPYHGASYLWLAKASGRTGRRPAT